MYRFGSFAFKGSLHTIFHPFANNEVKYFVQFLSFPRSGHSLIGSLLDAHPNAIISHELDTMGLVHKGLPKRSIYGLVKINSETFTQNGRYWNGFSYQAENQPHGYAEKLKVINVHMRHFPNNPDQFIFDMPYRETIDLFTYDSTQNESKKIASFDNHKPKRGQYRCDLHPCPSPDGRKIVVTSMEDGGRQIYLLKKSG